MLWSLCCEAAQLPSWCLFRASPAGHTSVLQLSQHPSRIVHTQLPQQHQEQAHYSVRISPSQTHRSRSFHSSRHLNELDLYIPDSSQNLNYCGNKPWVDQSISIMKWKLAWTATKCVTGWQMTPCYTLIALGPSTHSVTAWQLLHGSSRHFNRSHPPQLKIIKDFISVGFLQLVHAKSTTLLTAADAKKEEGEWHKRHL